MQQVGLENTDAKMAKTPQNKKESESIIKNLQGSASGGPSMGNLSADRVPFMEGRSLGSFGQHNCLACAAENQRNNDQEPMSRLRYNEKRVGPIFDELFRNVLFKVVPFGHSSDTSANGEMSECQNRHGKDIQFLNDFICK